MRCLNSMPKTSAVLMIEQKLPTTYAQKMALRHIMSVHT